jgi:hypothetical protein
MSEKNCNNDVHLARLPQLLVCAGELGSGVGREPEKGEERVTRVRGGMASANVVQKSLPLWNFLGVVRKRILCWYGGILEIKKQ